MFFAEYTEDYDGILGFLDKFSVTEVLLDYLYGLWMDADSGIDNEIFETLEMELQLKSGTGIEMIF